MHHSKASKLLSMQHIHRNCCEGREAVWRLGLPSDSISEQAWYVLPTSSTFSDDVSEGKGESIPQSCPVGKAGTGDLLMQIQNREANFDF